jgi:phenylacetate-CoA ligase
MNYLNKINLDFLFKSQYWTKEQLKELQFDGLKDLIIHAKKNCLFYKNLPIIHDIDDLKNIPILTKRQIHNNFSALTANNIPSCRKWTGGTSEQVVILSNLDQKQIIDMKIRFDSWHPKETWKRQAVVWGGGELAHKEPYEVRNALHEYFGIYSVHYFPIEWMVDEETTLRYLKMMVKFNPTSIRGYASALRKLSYYAIKHNIKLSDLKCIINNCEPLTEDTRKLAREAFNAEIFNFYGSQDLGSMAQDCEKHEGLHLGMERYILEIMPDGRLIWTDLLNYAMPLIRYENGDIGELDKSCSCGRGLTTLKNIVGRTFQYLWTKQGTWLNVTEINEAMYYDVPNYLDLIEAHQVQQDEKGKIKLLLKPWDKNKLPNMTIIQKYFANRLDIEIIYVDEMVLSKSGKQLACITKFRPPWINKNEWEIDRTEG